MLRTRVIPALLLRNESLVKTNRFGRFRYIGDPCNTVRIFNELEVDELAFFDITATREKRVPNYHLLQDISNECFMPLAYGGGISSLSQARQIFQIGFEKVILNSHAIKNPELISRIAGEYGTQATVVSIDVKKGWLGREYVMSHGGRQKTKLDPTEWAMTAENYGAGEIILTSIPHEGTWQGMHYDLIKRVSEAVSIPVVAQGGAGSVDDIVKAVHYSNASAVAIGSMVVFQKKDMGVLVNFPDDKELSQKLQR